METKAYKGFLLAVLVWTILGTGNACQDIDHDACAAMAKQNTQMCSDQVLSNTACPVFCKKCPVTCYNCNSTTSDVSQCNTVTCAKGEMCILKTVSGVGNTDKFSMLCGPRMICSIGRKRNQQYSDDLSMQARSTSISLKCCDTDLCNSPPQLQTTKKTTSTTIKPTTTIKATTRTMVMPTKTSTSTSAPTTRLTVNQTPVTQYASQQQTPCKRDIIIMLEDCSPMRPFYSAIKSALSDIISQIDIGYDKTRVAFGTFDHTGTKLWNLDSHMDKASLLSAINQISSQSWAITGNNLVAINFVLQSFSQGNRPTVPDDVIFLTEGHSPHFFSHHKESVAVQSLHQKSNNVITVGFGSVNQNEIHQISTDRNHFFYIQDYSHYNHQSIVSNILNLICK